MGSHDFEEKGLSFPVTNCTGFVSHYTEVIQFIDVPYFCKSKITGILSIEQHPVMNSSREQVLLVSSFIMSKVLQFLNFIKLHNCLIAEFLRIVLNMIMNVNNGYCTLVYSVIMASFLVKHVFCCLIVVLSYCKLPCQVCL